MAKAIKYKNFGVVRSCNCDSYIQRAIKLGIWSNQPTPTASKELREDGGNELREDGGIELREN